MSLNKKYRICNCVIIVCKQAIKAVIFILIFIISGCETQTTWNLQTEEIPIIIIEGIITNEIKTHEIKISKPVTNLNDPPEAVSNATVAIYDQDSIYFLTKNSANSGVYQTDSNFGAVVGKKYTLYIEYLDKTYSAT